MNSMSLKDTDHVSVHNSKPTIPLPEPFVFFSPRPVNELDDAATKLQKVYNSYRTRRNLADCVVVVEELWWKALDFSALKRSSVSFFNIEKPETTISRWERARTRVAKIGKGLSKDENAQKLALQHWLEALLLRTRYERLTSAATDQVRRPRRHWVMKMNRRLKGLRLSRSRKLNWNLFPKRIAEIYADVVVDSDDICPTIIFSCQ